jgi:hypothetical protein
MATSIVKVYNSRYNELAAGVKVSLGFDGIMSLGFTRDVYTDSNGVAVVEHSGTGNCTVYVNGSRKDDFYAPGSITVTI